MLVIGTAGHIYHGKSAVVKRLTGTDPDRLPEEKERGMTIDLGFAFRQTDSGERIAFVDVPGHERFVKNMIAGVGGIDAVMLVIAADDGWMPQTQEHFQIVRLLGIENGLIVINKIDLVDSEWLDLLEEDIRDKVKGSSLADAPIFKLSAKTGSGCDRLQDYLDDLPDKLTFQRDISKARLYIDRSFVLPGIGGVVTGTLRGGAFASGQTISIWPSMTTARIRSLRANNCDTEKALPGQRTAISLTGVDKDLLVRGGVISDRLDLSLFKKQPVLALAIEMLAEASVSLTDRRQALFITGTTEVQGEIRLLKQKQIAPSQKGIIFFKPEHPVYTLVGDHFILRLPTPMVTLGGGRILDHLEHIPRRKQIAQCDYLEKKLSWKLEDIVTSELTKRVVVRLDRFLLEAAISAKQVNTIVKRMTADGTLRTFNGFIVHREYFEDVIEVFMRNIAEFFDGKPHLKGLSRDEMIRLSVHDDETTGVILDYLLSEGILVRLKDKYNLAGRGMSLKGGIKAAYIQLMKQLREQPLTPPKLSKLAEGGKDYREAIKYIVESGEGYKCGSDFIFLSDTWDEITNFIKEQIQVSGKLAVSNFKEKFGMTRKFTIPILEETDRIGLTRRDGDLRFKGDSFEK